jgi:hypothetical protein
VSKLERINARHRELCRLVALSWGREAVTPAWMLRGLARLVRLRNAMEVNANADKERPRGRACGQDDQSGS